jgi:fibronectin-binding autotransporter adhesin
VSIRRKFPVENLLPTWVAVAAALAAASVQAVDITWDNSGTDFNTGTNWVGNTAPGANDRAVFTTAGGPLNNPIVDTSQTLQGFYFTGTSAYTVSGGGGFGTKTLTITSQGIVNDSSALQTFQSGTRTLALSLSVNTAFTANGTGSLFFNSNLGGITIGSTRTLTLGGNSTAASTIAEIIADSSNNGRLTKTGTGTWVLSGLNTYGGPTTISDGVLSVSNLANGGMSSNLGNSSNAAANLVFDGGTLRHTLNGADSTNRNFTITAGKTATIDISDAAGNLTISGAAAATTGGLTKIGAGTLTLSGANAYTGATTIGSAGGAAGGTITLGGNERISNSSSVTVYAGTFNVNSRTETIAGLNLGGGAAGTTAAVTMTSGTLNLGGNLTYNAANDPNGATISGGTLGLGANRVFTVADSAAASSDLTISSVISGAGFGIDKQGAGTFVLAGANTYTGATTVTDGTVIATHSSALGTTAGGTSVAGAAVLELQNNVTIGAEALALTGTLRSNSGTNTFGGAISGTGTVTVGGGSLTLSGTAANTYNGATTVGDGSLILAKTAGTNAVAGPLTIGDGSGSASSAVVQLTNANQIADTAAVTLLADGRLNLAGRNETVGSVDSAATAANIQLGAGTLTTGGSNASTSFAGVIAGTGGLTKAGTGTFTLTGANTYTGATTISQGTLRLGGAGVLADTTAVTVGAAGVFDLNNQTETVGSIAGAGAILIGTGQLITGADDTSTSFTGTLTGDSTAILAKNGTGTLTFGGDVNAGAADFAGIINLNAGGLAFDVDNAFTGTLNVFAGTTLKLSDANLSVANLNFAGSGSITLDFSGASTLNVDHLTIAAGITVNVINWTNATDYFFAQNWAGAVAEVRGASPMNQVVFASFTAADTKWQSYDHQVTPVPEPSTYGALLIGAVGALLGWRRWRQRRTVAPARD